MNRTIWLTGLVLVACGGSSSGGTLDAGLVSDGAFVEPTDASTLDAQTDAQVESPSTAVAFDTQGLTIARGHVGWFLAEDCVGLDNCYANNPATPYGLIFLPPAADEALPEIAPPFLDGDLRAAWRLAGDEAVVLVGRTPPESAYYGFTPYLYEREGTELFASLGDTLNPDVVGESPFDREIAYVFVSNAALAERITRALRSVGLGDDAIFVQPIPTEYVRFGHDTAADALSFLVRTALPTDEAAMEAYRVDTPFEVFRVQGGEALEPGSLATLPIRPKGLEGVNEDDLADALDALRNAVVLRHGGVPVPFVNTEFEGYECIERGRECLGDNRDTPYLNALPQRLDADESLFVFGVRHDRTELATYVALAITQQAQRRGIGGFTGRDTDGSAEAYLPGDPSADRLFVYEIARECGARSFCFEVPTGDAGVALDETMLLTWRVYLQPGTRTGAPSEDLLAPRLLRARR